MDRRLLTGLVGLAFVPAVVSIAALIAPHLALSPLWTDITAFAGATLTTLVALSLLSRGSLHRWLRIALFVAAPLTVLAIALSNGQRPAHAIAIAASLTVFGHVLGDFIGHHIEDPGHLLPASIVASVADVVSVLHPSGPSHSVIASEHGLSWMAVAFPVPGTSALAPAIGVGDLLFIALLLAAARRHALPWRRGVLLIAAGIAVAGFASYSLEAAIPALPAIGLAFIAGIPGARKLRPKDRTLAIASMVGALVLGGSLLASRFLLQPAP